MQWDRSPRSRGGQVGSPSAAHAEPQGDLSLARTHAPVPRRLLGAGNPLFCVMLMRPLSSRARSWTSWRMESGEALPTVDGMRHGGTLAVPSRVSPSLRAPHTVRAASLGRLIFVSR